MRLILSILLLVHGAAAFFFVVSILDRPESTLVVPINASLLVLVFPGPLFGIAIVPAG